MHFRRGIRKLTKQKMIHKEKSPLAGQTIKIKESSNLIKLTGANEIWIEDWWDRVYGKSWMDADYNPAAMSFGMRSGMSTDIIIPTDDEVLYGKIGLGYLVHVSELEIG